MRTTLPLLVPALLLAACGDGSTTSGPAPGPHPLPQIPDGKTDSYISTNAREFELTGHAHAALPEGFTDLDADGQAAAVEEAVGDRLAIVARSVQRHVEGLIRDANGGISGEDAKFFSYFKRNAGEVEETEVTEDGRARFSFMIELVGSVYLMSKVAPDTGSKRTFDVEIKGWNEPEGETVTVEIAGSSSRDAFPRYDLLFEDGVFDIALHVGGDYNEERFDIETAKWTVEYLLEGGWVNEGVASFEELALDSPPFVRSVTVEGKEVEVRVFVYHADLDGAGDQTVLADAVKRSVAEQDVVIYSGHAGSNAGFLLDYHPRYELRASDFATLPLADKYQIYVFDGCRTYRTYVDDMLKNPAKSFENLDLLTTVNTTPFGAGYQVIHELLYWFTLTDVDGNHFPLSWKTLLRGINTRRFEDVHYGVHGVDDDPQLNPHGGQELACQPCASDADCGAGGNYCLGYSAGPACGIACTTDVACGNGYRCARLWEDDEQWFLPKQCVRRDYLCPAE